MKYLLAIIFTLPTLAAPVPAFHSRPDAPNSLFLDADGADFNPRYLTPARPAYGGDAHAVWAWVATAFERFNVDVTTEEPANPTVRILIGGHNDGPIAGTGYSNIGGFGSDWTLTGYVYSADMGENWQLTAWITAHEAGHVLGLQHQSWWADGVKVGEYRLGPIMGHPDGDAEFVTGINSLGVIQDDVAVIGGAVGFAEPVGEPGTMLALAGGCYLLLIHRHRRQSRPRPSASGTSVTRRTISNPADLCQRAVSASGASTNRSIGSSPSTPHEDSYGRPRPSILNRGTVLS